MSATGECPSRRDGWFCEREEGHDGPHVGGPAFWSEEVSLPAVTLRDYFAGQALAGLLANPNRIGSFNEAADVAYEHADAMLAARSTGRPE